MAWAAGWPPDGSTTRTFDHGAQFFTTRSAEFARVVDGWIAAGDATTWFRGPLGDDTSGGHSRFRGVVSMNALAKHMAEGLDVRRRTQVTAVRPLDGAWLLQFEADDPIEARAVVLTAPVPQSIELLDAGGTRLAPADRRALEAIRYDPCLAVMVRLAGPSGLAGPGAVRPDVTEIDWIADNSMKGISAVPALTIHASAPYTRAAWDSDDADIVDDLLGLAPVHASAVHDASRVHRWRYARPLHVHHEPFLAAAAASPLVFAGDGFGGPKVEGAVLSGARWGQMAVRTPWVAGLLGLVGLTDSDP